MPDRLKAGLQFLVLTMLVRIQLGQQRNPFSEAERVFCFSIEIQALLEIESEKQKTIFRFPKNKVSLSINSYWIGVANPALLECEVKKQKTIFRFPKNKVSLSIKSYTDRLSSAEIKCRWRKPIQFA